MEQGGRPDTPMADASQWKNDNMMLTEVAYSAEGGGAPEHLRPALEATGCDVMGCSQFSCSAWIPVEHFPEIEALEEVFFLRPSFVQSKQAGSVVSEALESLQIDNLRNTIDPTLTGEGLTIGVLSDSYDTLGGEAADIASGDLPSDVVVLRELTGGGGIDEGRAMMQLIHDLVPAAKLVFHTAFEGPQAFADGIRLLADSGCDVIVDDIGYLTEPFFLDGVIAKAANDVAESMNVPYFSSAGNSAKQSWEGVYNPSGAIDENGCEFHDFGGGQTRQLIVPSSASQTIKLQWDDAFFSVSGKPGTLQDIDLIIVDAGTNNAIASDLSFNTGGDPVAFVQFTVSGPYEIMITHCNAVSDPPPLLKWINFSSVSSIEFDTESSTSFGHPNAEFAAGVGAAFFQDTPAFGAVPPLLENFSSRGGTPILFNADGSRKPEAEVRLQPRFTATDGTINTFFGQPGNFLPNGSGFFFFGTSAASPHAAAVAALLLQVRPSLTPMEVYEILESTAIDIGPDGFDFDSGNGLVNAFAAVTSVLTEKQPTSQTASSPEGYDICSWLGFSFTCRIP